MIRLKNILLESDSSKQVKILFMGDSQTAGNSYASRFKNHENFDVTIDAVSGRNTTKMRQALLEKDLKNFDVVVILGGGNDAWRKTHDKAASNLKQMYSFVKSNNPNAKLVAITNPTKQHHPNPEKYPSNDAIADSIKASNVPDAVIDANSLDDSHFRRDMIHLNDAGHSWLYQQLIDEIDDIEAKEPESVTDVVLQRGDINRDVKEMQEYLIYLDYSVGPMMNDSIFGPYTEQGVKDFQKDHDIRVTGIYDTETKQVLDNLVSDVDKSEIIEKLRIVTPNRSVTISSDVDYNRSDAKKWGDNVIDALDMAALEYNLSKQLLYTIANIESNGNPEARNPKTGAAGLFQILPKYFPTYGVTKDTVWNPYINAEAAAKKISKRRGSIKKVVDDVSNLDAYTYMAHQQGHMGFLIIYNACKNYSKSDPKTALINSAKDYDYDEQMGEKVLRNMKANGGKNPCSFIEKWIKKYQRNKNRIQKRIS